jgi:nucleotide-binding universal stress UspA family protein
MTTVLLPIDTSDASRRALQYVLEAGVDRHSQIHLVNVQPPIKARELWHFLEDDRIVESREAAGHEVLRAAGEQLRAAGYDCVARVLIGDPVETILRYADEKGCDAIVMGSRRRGRVGKLMLGSVSFEVANRAARPVTLVGAVPQAA